MSNLLTAAPSLNKGWIEDTSSYKGDKEGIYEQREAWYIQLRHSYFYCLLHSIEPR